MDNNQPQKDAAASDDENRGGEQVKFFRFIFGGHRRSRLRHWVLAGIAAFFWLAGSISFNIHNVPAWLSLFLILVGGICGAFSGRQFAINNPKGDKHRNLVFGIVVAAFIALCGSLAWFEYRSLPGPRFRFMLNTEDFPHVNLELSNDFLKVKHKGKDVVSGIVFIPIQEAQSNVSISIVIINDSDVVPEFPSMRISIPTEWSPSPEMRRAETPNTSAEMLGPNGYEPQDIQSWIVNFPPGMLPNEGWQIRGIKFFPKLYSPPNSADSGFMMIKANSKDLRNVNAVWFRVICVPPIDGQELKRPIVLSQQRKSAKEDFRVIIPASQFNSHRGPVRDVLIIFPNRPGYDQKSAKTVSTQPFEFGQKHRFVTFTVGSINLILDAPPEFPEAPNHPFRSFLGDKMQFTIERGKIWCDFEFAPSYGMPPLKLEKNKLSGLPPSWDCNSSGRALEVVNDKSDVIFQIFYKDDTHLVYEGVFINTNTAAFASPYGEFKTIRNVKLSYEDIMHEIGLLHLKRIFKYPAWKYPGQFDDDQKN